MNADEFKAGMLALAEPPADSRPPHWAHWRRVLWEHALAYPDPLRFFEWPCIYHTMLVNHWSELVEAEYHALVRGNGGSWLPATVPGPEAVHDKFTGMPYSKNLVHQVYHLLRFKEATGWTPHRFGRVVEFGGGYGAMALVLRRLGFDGPYAIIDFPEFALLQQFYLSEAGVEGVEWPASARTGGDIGVVIGCYSLSEATPETRRVFMDEHPAAAYLFLYSDRFARYDNVAFFQEELPDTIQRSWVHERVEHLPPGSWYTFGS